jgi:hypothetical protein
VASADFNTPAENINIVDKTGEALLDGIKEIGLEVNPEKAKYTSMLMSPCQKAGQNIACR